MYNGKRQKKRQNFQLFFKLLYSLQQARSCCKCTSGLNLFSRDVPKQKRGKGNDLLVESSQRSNKEDHIHPNTKISKQYKRGEIFSYSHFEEGRLEASGYRSRCSYSLTNTKSQYHHLLQDIFVVPANSEGNCFCVSN